MTIYEIRDSKVLYKKRLEIYKNNNVLDYSINDKSNYKIKLGFDQCFYIGKGNSEEEALLDAERQWREDKTDYCCVRWFTS